MRRHYDSSLAAISLFPFLSVLLVTIGTLSLIITVYSLISTDSAGHLIRLDPDKIEVLPHFVECNADGVVIHPQRTLIPIDQITKANTGLASLFTDIQTNSTSQSLIFLVRKDGFKSFNQAFLLAKQYKIKIGYEPLFEDRSIRVRINNTKHYGQE